MRTIERNYRKNPHTANFLQTFHTGVGSNGRNYREEMSVDDNAAEYELAAQDGDDLLNLVPTTTPEFQPSPAQVKFLDDLIRDIDAMDSELGRQAKDYTVKMIGHWTPGKDGNLSRWIDRLKSKRAALRAAAPAPKAPAAPVVEIPASVYGIHHDGEVKCYTVDYGKTGTKWEGFLFLNRVSSDDRFPVKNPAAKAEILAAIRADVEGAEILAGLTLRRCRRCGRELSDTKNPYFSVALGPDCGQK